MKDETDDKVLKIDEQLLATISHEIRTPLSAMVGFTELLNDTKLDRQQRDYLQTIQSTGNNLLHVLEDLLDQLKEKTAAQILNKQSFELAETVWKVQKLLMPQARSKGITLEVRLAKDLPKMVYGDKVKFDRILMNLVTNALKFTADGGIDIVLEKTPGPDSKKFYIRLAIKDSGIGIDPEKLGLIFNAFQQADEPDASKRGWGLGLAIVRDLVALFGGKISVESIPGEGSTFICILPFEVAPDATIQKTLPVEPAGQVTEHSPCKVLLAEDNNTNGRLAMQVLKKRGFEVEWVKDGTAVLEALEAGSFDVILMDVQMNGQNGLQTTRLIRTSNATYSNIPIIALTAQTFTNEKDLCLDAGMNAFLSKPYSPLDLFATIEKVMLQRQPAIL